MADKDSITRWLRWRRLLRWSSAASGLLLAGSVVLDHAGAFGYRGNDLRRFDHRPVVVTRVVCGDTLAVRAPDGATTNVHLIGVDTPGLASEFWGTRAAAYTTARATGRTITLRLDPVGWRNAQHELMAYAFINDSDNLNADLLRDGQGYADRRYPHSLQGVFEAAEAEARRKKRGLWKEIAVDQMPAWRQDWLKRRGF